jgi:hypothetical protein
MSARVEAFGALDALSYEATRGDGVIVAEDLGGNFEGGCEAVAQVKLT